MSITIKDVASKTGYTIATVSRALNNNPLVSDKTREKIIKAAEEMGYYPNELARGLVKKTLQTVGVIVPDITNPYYPLLVKSIQETLQKNGYNMLLCNSDWNQKNEIELIKMLYAHRVTGIIMDPTCNDSYNNIKKLGFKLPIVFIGNRTCEDEISFVIVDNFKGMQLATDYIIRLGHKKIAYIGCLENVFTHKERFKGYKDTIIDRLGRLDEQLIKLCNSKSESGYKAMQTLIQEDNTPTAVLAGNDIIALGVIECLGDYGYKVPQDISVVGFDNIEYASLKKISLTTVSEPRYEIGSKASSILLGLIEKDDNIVKKIILQPELVIRNTCRPLKI